MGAKTRSAEPYAEGAFNIFTDEMKKAAPAMEAALMIYDAPVRFPKGPLRRLEEDGRDQRDRDRDAKENNDDPHHPYLGRRVHALAGGCFLDRFCCCLFVFLTAHKLESRFPFLNNMCISLYRVFRGLSNGTRDMRKFLHAQYYCGIIPVVMNGSFQEDIL